MQKAVAPAKKETVTLRHLAADLAESHGLPTAKANEMLTGMVDAIAGHLKRGRRIRMSCFTEIAYQTRCRQSALGITRPGSWRQRPQALPHLCRNVPSALRVPSQKAGGPLRRDVVATGRISATDGGSPVSHSRPTNTGYRRHRRHQSAKQG